MRSRAVALAACFVWAFAAAQAFAQSMPLGGFDFSAWNNVASAASRNETATVKSLLIAGNHPDVTDTDGQTALGYAASFGNVEMTQLLLQYKAPVDDRDKFGNAPLHWAAQRGSIDVMQLLLDAKATVDAANKQGITPLMMAADKGQVLAVRLLLKHGADPQKSDFTGRDALAWAEGKPNILQALHSAN
jgi:ankyrin repeat protein